MEIYLIRHTTPLVEKGICYGQTDLDVTHSFKDEANLIKPHLPSVNATIHCSPLQRCSKLAMELFGNNNITYSNELKEINCGSWEMQHWDAIPKQHLDPFMLDFVNIAMPEGESYVDIYERVVDYFNTLLIADMPIAIVAHGGVIRSILSFITKTPLIDSFSAFKIYYGCVIKLTKTNNIWQYSILHNVEPEQQEQHKPS